LALLATLVGCAGLPHRRPEDALSIGYDTSSTPLAAAVREGEELHPGQSGFALLNDGAAAFHAREDLIDLSQCTLDMQYFIWDLDHTGQVLLEKVLEAARRGVRVRILLDDFMQPGMDEEWRRVAAHPNVEVRLFNPFSSRRAPYLRRWMEFVARLKTLNHRMHNKLLLTDGAAAVIGGRNIGDQYYGVNLVYNHRDFDVLCVGKVARALSTDFELYWDSRWSVPIEDIWTAVPTPQEIAKATGERRTEIAAWPPWPYLEDKGAQDGESRLRHWMDSLVWARGRVYADPPSKVRREGDGVMMRAIQDFAAQVQKDVVIISPYWGLLNKRKERKALEAIRAKGIQIKVLTNSLDSIDGPWSHVGWVRARGSLVEHGVEVHEMRPDPACRSEHTAFVSEGKEMILHSKVAVADCHLVFVGTMNLDPRSVSTNTEVAVVIDSPELARQVLEYVMPDFLPQNSWRVELGSNVPGECGKKAGKNGLVWITEREGQPECLPKEPGSGSFKHIARGLLGLFPINKLL
jgi:putative cardiolipin synthase